MATSNFQKKKVMEDLRNRQKISFSPIFLKAFPLSFTAGPSSSGSISVVFRFTVSPQTPLGSKRLFMQVA